MKEENATTFQEANSLRFRFQEINSKYLLLQTESMKLNDLFVPTTLLMFRKTTELTELRAQKDLLSSTLKQREASLEAARDDNLRLLSALSQRPKETVVSESSSSADLAGELRECQRQRDELEVYLQHVLQDMEDKTPLLESLRSNYDALRHNYEQLLSAWNQNLKWKYGSDFT